MTRERKSIFITGAASGMGRETALLFAEKGWFVGAFDLNADALATLASEIGEANGVFGTLDVTDRDGFAAAVARFGDATGDTLDVMFNNAGIAVRGMIDEQPWEEIARTVEINLMGVIIGVRKHGESSAIVEVMTRAHGRHLGMARGQARPLTPES